jgi:hypothetical protein
MIRGTRYYHDPVLLVRVPPRQGDPLSLTQLMAFALTQTPPDHPETAVSDRDAAVVLLGTPQPKRNYPPRSRAPRVKSP